MSVTREQRSELRRLQRETFRYFWDLANPDNGLVPDSTKTGAPSSIAATGLGLASYAVAAENGWIPRSDAVERVRTTLRTFWYGPGANELDAISYRGFFYHFLDMKTGHRTGRSELSTIDTTFLLAGGLLAGLYFDDDNEAETEIRELADSLYRRADWRWALAGGEAVSHGWKPESGFIRYHWQGYNEALILYALALGSPTYPIPASSYRAWTDTYQWKKLYDLEFLYAGPLFVHQLSHIWIDFRGLQDAYMREKGIDYFENSRRATIVQQRYAIRNPREFLGYDEYVWGISASDGPGPAVHRVRGKERRFWDYKARAIPWGPDDGTLTPWAVVASLPFEPALVVRTLEEIDRRYPDMRSELGYKCSFNPTFPGKSGARGWVSMGYYGIEQGPVLLMIENFRNEFIWNLMQRCSYLENGLRRAGFRGGWLDSAPRS
jgi:hypothetical protein